MEMEAIIKDVLLDNPKISALLCKPSMEYQNITYDFLLSCEFIVFNQKIPMIIGVPNNWEQALVDIFVENYLTFPFIPHIDINGKICLFDLEGVLIDVDFGGILNQCVGQAICIIEDGLTEKNKVDFINEFSLYWCQQKNARKMKCEIPIEKKCQIIKYTNPQLTQKNNESYSQFLNRQRNAIIFGAVNRETFYTWDSKGTQYNGLFCSVDCQEFIYPPDPRNELDLSYLNRIFALIYGEDMSRIIKKTGNDKLFVICLKQPNDAEVTVGVLIKNATYNITDLGWQITETKKTELIPLCINRIDKTYLFQRVNTGLPVQNIRILLIGCGSIGGYLAYELVKSGFEDITLVDSDKLTEENICRHLLGASCVGKYKTKALIEYFTRNIPQIKVKSVEDSIRVLVEENSIDFNDYNLILSATGNHNINRWINKKMFAQRIRVPVIYVWNEPLDCGYHLGIFEFEKKGCYECIFDENLVNGELFDKTAFAASGQRTARRFSGCGGSYIPYGSSVSLKSAALCVTWINKLFDGRLDENVVVSVKGEGYYFTKAGFDLSEKYHKQDSEMEILTGGDLHNKKCRICG